LEFLLQASATALGILIAGFSDEQIVALLRKIPMLLTCSLEDKLKPTLEALERVLGSRAEVLVAVSKAAGLAVMALETMKSNVELMRGFGLSAREIRQSVARQLQLFLWDYAGEVMQAKFCYFEAVLGSAPRDVLLKKPGYLKSSLHGIDKRVGASRSGLPFIAWL
jgi:hypothetical protein